MRFHRLVTLKLKRQETGYLPFCQWRNAPIVPDGTIGVFYLITLKGGPATHVRIGK